MRPICSFARVANDGRIICTKIAQGDNEVSPALCFTCPARQCSCDHLRFSLVRTSPSPFIVRWNGRTDVWNNEPPQVAFLRAACAAKITPLPSSQECLSCELRTGSLSEKRGEYIRIPVKGRTVSPGPTRLD